MDDLVALKEAIKPLNARLRSCLPGRSNTNDLMLSTAGFYADDTLILESQSGENKDPKLKMERDHTFTARVLSPARGELQSLQQVLVDNPCRPPQLNTPRTVGSLTAYPGLAKSPQSRVLRKAPFDFLEKFF